MTALARPVLSPGHAEKALARLVRDAVCNRRDQRSFYRTPSLEAVRGWAGQTPKDFVFAWKASRFITHWKRLSAKSENSIALMVTRLEALGPQAGPVLFQLPARFTANRERLAAFLPMLPQPYRYAFEFRDASWYDDTIFDLLRQHRVALCISDHREAPAPWEVTARHVYVRGHGPTGEYRDNYPDKTLRRWARAIARWSSERRTVYVYFDNDWKSAAPADAQRLNLTESESRGRLGEESNS